MAKVPLHNVFGNLFKKILGHEPQTKSDWSKVSDAMRHEAAKKQFLEDYNKMFPGEHEKNVTEKKAQNG